jgi:hypothetical protein
MQASLMRKESATEAWETIRGVHIGGDRIREANADKLWCDFSDVQYMVGECVKDFTLRVTALTNQLRTLGDKISEKDEIKKLLHSSPKHLEQVVISIETLLDLNSMMIEESTCHLHIV